MGRQLAEDEGGRQGTCQRRHGQGRGPGLAAGQGGLQAYSCHMFPGANAWPTQRINTTDHNFSGVVGPVEFMQVCPEQCRRKGHEKDWIYC